ncbi:MAG: LLM class F420-dependent oxidoreductase [Solirubrobacterales bacterium]|nr:LLM class F420-dependent oxidoreductase [Solirubrobacterales bacterium]
MQLGEFGVWATYRAVGEENAGEAAKLVEALGFGAFWLGGSPQLPALEPLLEATERIVVATGILNVWASEPDRVASDFAELEARFPGRVLLGIGIGHPEATSHYSKPLAAMQAFLDRLDAAASSVPGSRRCLAALGPRMLKLSAERSLGAHTYFVPVEHTRAARETLGETAVLAPELACVLDDDVDSARSKARAYAALYLGLRNYTNNLLNHGFGEQDIADGGSDRLIDAIIPHGGAETIAAAARRHLSGGADHVCLQTVGVEGIPRSEWTALASALGTGKLHGT